MQIRPYRLLGCALALVLAAGTVSAGQRNITIDADEPATLRGHRRGIRRPPRPSRRGTRLGAGRRHPAARSRGKFGRLRARGRAFGLRGGALQGGSEGLGSCRDRALALGRADRRERALPRRVGGLPPRDRASRGLARDLRVQRAHRPQRALRPRHRADRERSDLGSPVDRGARPRSGERPDLVRRRLRSLEAADAERPDRRHARRATPGRAKASTLAR